MSGPVSTQHRRARGEGWPAVEIAFVNNMPSSAFDATEQQFIGLLENAALELGGTTVRLGRYVLAGLERSAEVQARIGRDYRPIELVYGEQPDGLIVTGTEPIADDLRSEPYWGALSELIAWAEDGATSAVVSCLAAHAAALLFDGIERETLPAKCSGVFVQDVTPGHALTDGLGRTVHMPHSRLNDLPSALMQDGGYASLVESREMNWTLAVKKRRRCVFVLVQGHPEYSTTSLLREYRRDLQRFARGERPEVPSIPVGYMDARSHRLLESFEARVRESPARQELMSEFPFEAVSEQLVNTWQGAATRLYANWLQMIRPRRNFGA
jgi:homoserine O-succinyltransferase